MSNNNKENTPYFFESDQVDNYLDYLDDALGYTWDAWDKTPTDVRAQHDRILRFGLDAIPEENNDLFRLALLRFHTTNEEYIAAFSTLLRLLETQTPHPTVAYHEVYERGARLLLSLIHRGETPTELTPAVIEKIFLKPSDSEWSKEQPYYLAFYHLLEGGNFEKSVGKLLQEERNEEIQFQLGEDLLTYGYTTEAIVGLNALEEQLSDQPEHPLLVDIQVLKSQLQPTR